MIKIHKTSYARVQTDKEKGKAKCCICCSCVVLQIDVDDFMLGANKLVVNDGQLNNKNRAIKVAVIKINCNVA